MQFVEHDEIVFRCWISGVETERIRVRDQINATPAELTVRAGQMEVPIELLTNRMNDERVLVGRKLIDPLGPEWNREAEEQHGFDQHHGKFQMRRDAALDAFMIGHRMTPFAETKQHKGEESRPPEKERSHEPVAELDDVIDLIAVLGSIRRQAEKFVNQREMAANHTRQNLPASAPGAVRAECWRDAKDES